MQNSHELKKKKAINVEPEISQRQVFTVLGYQAYFGRKI